MIPSATKKERKKLWNFAVTQKGDDRICVCGISF